ncbi:MAG: hypothetical protein WBA12_01845 [Catalinimonas sp.]
MSLGKFLAWGPPRGRYKYEWNRGTIEREEYMRVSEKALIDSDVQNRRKPAEYLRAGVRCAWFIYPEARQVWVFTGVDQVRICTEAHTCSAAPALNFAVFVRALFPETENPSD